MEYRCAHTFRKGITYFFDVHMFILVWVNLKLLFIMIGVIILIFCVMINLLILNLNLVLVLILAFSTSEFKTFFRVVHHCFLVKIVLSFDLFVFVMFIYNLVYLLTRLIDLLLYYHAFSNLKLF